MNAPTLCNSRDVVVPTSYAEPFVVDVIYLRLT